MMGAHVSSDALAMATHSPIPPGQIVPGPGTNLLCPDIALDEAAYAAARIEKIERDRGLSAADARSAAARRAGVSPGTLEKLSKGRLKAVAMHVYARLRAALVSALDEEKKRLEHELAIARHAPLGADLAALRQAEAALQQAREILRQAHA
jgi:transposase-like protein